MLNGEPAELENCVSTTRGREAGRAAEIKLFDFISFYWRGRAGRRWFVLRTEMTQRFWVKTALSDDFPQFMVSQPEYQVELRLCNETW